VKQGVHTLAARELARESPFRHCVAPLRNAATDLGQLLKPIFPQNDVVPPIRRSELDRERRQLVPGMASGGVEEVCFPGTLPLTIREIERRVRRASISCRPKAKRSVSVSKVLPFGRMPCSGRAARQAQRLAIVSASEDPRTARMRLADMIAAPFAICGASAMQQRSNIRLRMELRMGAGSECGWGPPLKRI
jgi:hypothetical protein